MSLSFDVRRDYPLLILFEHRLHTSSDWVEFGRSGGIMVVSAPVLESRWWELSNSHFSITLAIKALFEVLEKGGKTGEKSSKDGRG